MTLGAPTSDDTLWKETCAAIRTRLPSPYLRAALGFLTSFDEDYDEVLIEVDLQLVDRSVAAARNTRASNHTHTHTRARAYVPANGARVDLKLVFALDSVRVTLLVGCFHASLSNTKPKQNRSQGTTLSIVQGVAITLLRYADSVANNRACELHIWMAMTMTSQHTCVTTPGWGLLAGTCRTRTFSTTWTE